MGVPAPLAPAEARRRVLAALAASPRGLTSGEIGYYAVVNLKASACRAALKGLVRDGLAVRRTVKKDVINSATGCVIRSMTLDVYFSAAPSPGQPGPA